MSFFGRLFSTIAIPSSLCSPIQSSTGCWFGNETWQLGRNKSDALRLPSSMPISISSGWRRNRRALWSFCLWNQVECHEWKALYLFHLFHPVLHTLIITPDNGFNCKQGMIQDGFGVFFLSSYLRSLFILSVWVAWWNQNGSLLLNAVHRTRIMSTKRPRKKSMIVSTNCTQCTYCTPGEMQLNT